MFAELDNECLVDVLQRLDPVDVVHVRQCCKHLARVGRDSLLWRRLYRQHFSSEPVAQEVEDCGDWFDLFRESARQTRMRALTWNRMDVSGRCRPAAREGHAMCAMDDRHLLIFGGFGQGIRNDVYILELRDGNRAVWHRPKVRGNERVPARYGHSFVRCGAQGDMFLSFGGLTRGGYVGEIDSLAVLRAVPGTLHLAASPADWEFEWLDVKVKGEAVTKRGYAALAASGDGRTVYVFGGITNSSCCNELSVLDVETWTWRNPECLGDVPICRFGSAAAVWGGQLWIVGGGQGNDLLRSGIDLTDVHAMDATTFTWKKVQIAGRPNKNEVLGRCNAYQQVGSKIVMFGGSLRTCRELSVLDMAGKAWLNPTVCGKARPRRSMSCGLAWARGKVIVHGGWVHSISQVGDLWLADLTLGRSDVEAAVRESQEAINDRPSCSARDAGVVTRSRGLLARSSSPAAACLRADISDASSSDSDEDMEVVPGANPQALAVYTALCNATSASLSAFGLVPVSHFFRMQALRSNLMGDADEVEDDNDSADDAGNRVNLRGASVDLAAFAPPEDASGPLDPSLPASDSDQT